MNRLRSAVLAAIAAFALTGCEPAANTTAGNATAKNANANANANTSTAAAPTAETLMALERSAYDAWKNKDLKFWDDFLASNVVMMGPSGTMNKAAIIKQFSGMECEVKNISYSDPQVSQLGPDTALITHKLSRDGSCGGEKLSENAWVATLYLREGGEWKAGFHAEYPIADPNAQPAASAAKPAATSTDAAATADATTGALLAREKKAWEDWSAKDAKGLEDWAGAKMVTFTDNGRVDKAGAVKTWTTDDCKVKSTSFSNASSTSFGPNVTLLTFKASPDGTCGGNPLPPLNGATIYTKEGETWNADFSVNIPAQ